jgi:hypothetical protein
VDAFGIDPPAAARLDRVVDAEHHRSGWCKGIEQQAEQDAGGCPRAPDHAVEHAMVVGEPPFPAEPGDPQGAGHGAPAGREDGADQQQLGMAPYPLLHEHRREG